MNRKGYWRMRLVTFVLVAFGISACTSTKLSSRWHDNRFSSGPLKSILVVAQVGSDVNRRILEEGLIERLGKSGVQGLASFRLAPELSDTDAEQELKALGKASGAEGVLIARLKGIEKVETFVPPRVEWVPAFGYGFYGYYSSAIQAVYQPGYTRVDRVVRHEIKVYSAKHDQLLWAGDTDSFNPDSVALVVREMAALIVSDMEEQGLIGGGS